MCFTMVCWGINEANARRTRTSRKMGSTVFMFRYVWPKPVISVTLMRGTVFSRVTSCGDSGE
jgi:hypothetical protein